MWEGIRIEGLLWFIELTFNFHYYELLYLREKNQATSLQNINSIEDQIFTKILFISIKVLDSIISYLT
jgi:hypothetical protein